MEFLLSTSVSLVKKVPQLLLVMLMALPGGIAYAAETGIYTIVDGEARVLRGTRWYRLAEGARAQDGDVLDVGEGAGLQLELIDGATVHLFGPAIAHAGAPTVGDKTPGSEMQVQRGWVKAAAPAKRPLRLRLATLTVDISSAVIVLHGDAGLAELFVESGTAKVSIPVRGKDAPPRDATADAYITRTGDRALIAASRPPPAFLSAMPRDFRDALPSLARQFAQAPQPLVVGREVTLAEAEPWLSGPARRSFVKRFTPRLADPEFRAAVAARPAAFPEWDRMLHPDKYRPKQPGELK